MAPRVIVSPRISPACWGPGPQGARQKIWAGWKSSWACSLCREQAVSSGMQRNLPCWFWGCWGVPSSEIPFDSTWIEVHLAGPGRNHCSEGVVGHCSPAQSTVKVFGEASVSLCPGIRVSRFPSVFPALSPLCIRRTWGDLAAARGRTNSSPCSRHGEYLLRGPSCPLYRALRTWKRSSVPQQPSCKVCVEEEVLVPAQPPTLLSSPRSPSPCPYPVFFSQANRPLGFYALFLWKRAWAEPLSLNFAVRYSKSLLCFLLS